MSDPNFTYKPNTLSLFENTNRTNPNSPILRGSICIDVAEILRLAKGEPSVTLDVSVWSKVSKNGNNYWTGSIKEQYNAGRQSDVSPPHEPQPQQQQEYGHHPDAPSANHPYSDIMEPPTPENDLPF